MTVYIKTKEGKTHVYENVQSVDKHLCFISLEYADGTETNLFESENEIIDIEE